MAQNKGVPTWSGLLCFEPGINGSLKLRVLYPAPSSDSWPRLSMEDVLDPFNLVQVERA